MDSAPPGNMIYSQLYETRGKGRVVTAGIVGLGHYATALLAQSRQIPLLRIAAIADRDVEACRSALAIAGVPAEQAIVCANRAEALRHLGQRIVVVEDAMLLMDLPLDVIAEATGQAEAGARHAFEAIRNGKHVAMISKEPDSVVGPWLAHLAHRAGVVYTQVDGDQHGLLMGWVSWLRSLGLEVVCAGKARDAEFVFDDDFSSATVAWDPNGPMKNERVEIAPADRRYLQFIPEGAAVEYIEARGRLLAGLPQPASFDLCETVVAANATGLVPDRPRLRQPIARITEIPGVLATMDEDGLLSRRGVIDLVTCLRGRHEGGMGGGVFAVVACANDYSRGILMNKGLIANRRRTTAVIYRPHHLCGVETPTSLLCAALLGVATGSPVSRPAFDLVMTASRPMKAGELLDCEQDGSLVCSIVPAQPLTGGNAIPAHLATGKTLRRDIAGGHVVIEADVEIPRDSFLYKLRLQQDAQFLGLPARG